jgi:hypothetical protein
LLAATTRPLFEVEVDGGGLVVAAVDEEIDDVAFKAKGGGEEGVLVDLAFEAGFAEIETLTAEFDQRGNAAVLADGEAGDAEGGRQRGDGRQQQNERAQHQTMDHGPVASSQRANRRRGILLDI